MWCPNGALGFPMFAEGQSGAAYLLNWPFYLISGFSQAYNFSLLAHFMLTIAGFYLFCRAIGSYRIASAAAAISWTYSSYFVRKMMFVNFIQTLTWTPIILFLWLKYRQDTRKQYILIIMSILIGIQFWAGHPQSSFFLLVMLTAIVLKEAISIYSWPIIFRLSIAILLGILIGSMQLLPTLRVMLESSRNVISGYSRSFQMSFPPGFFPALFWPDFFGSAAQGTFRGDWQAYEWELSSYFGIGTVILAMLADEKNQWNKFFRVMTFLGLLLSLGSFTVVYSLFDHIPLFNSFRIPSRWMILSVFGICGSASIGMSRLTRFDESNYKALRRKMLFVIIPFITILYFSLLSFLPDETRVLFHQRFYSAVIILALFGIFLLVYKKMYFGRRWILIFLCGLIFADFYNAGSFYPGFTKFSDVLKTPLPLAHLNKDRNNDVRIFSLLHESVAGRNWHQNWSIDGPENHYRYIRDTLPMYSGLIYGFQGFTFDEWSPLHSQRYFNLPNMLTQKLLNRMNVRYLLLPNTRLPFQGETIFQTPNMRLVLNHEALPRAMLLKGKKILDGPGMIVKAMKSIEYSPEKEVILEDSDAVIYSKNEPVGTVEISKYESHQVNLKVVCENPCFLFLADPFDSGWRCSVDGEKQPLFISDYFFRSTPIKEGYHEVSFEYFPQDLRLGLFLSCMGFCAAFCLLRMRPFANLHFVEPGVSLFLRYRYRMFFVFLFLITLISIALNFHSWEATFINWYM